MKILMIALIGMLGFTTTPTHSTTKKVDTKQSTITWKGYKVLGAHEGTIKIKDGGLEFEEGVLTGGKFTIDMATISTTDLEGEMKGKLDGHLNSPDFFATQEFPTASFVITKVVSRGKASDYKIKGDLTIKGITKNISFNAIVDEATATAKIQIDRTDFNVQYGSGSFFKKLGDNTIYDEFDLELNLVLRK